MEARKEVESEIVNVDDIEEAEKESHLVGRLVTRKHWNPSNLIEAIKRAWKPKHGMSSRVWEESKLILFSFDDVMDRDWVLKNQPWCFRRSLFAINKFTRGKDQQLSSSVNVTVEHASFWVRLYDVPFSCMNERSLTLFAKRVGILESVDTSGEDLFGKFIRFKVSVNITKPLVRGVTILVKGRYLWLPLKYESLPSFCFTCCVIGHEHKTCRTSNRSLKYSSLDLIAPPFITGEKFKAALPHDIIEIILLRLPAKCLVRFKVVCKMWEATISDPRFAETHLQRCKKSTSRNLLAFEVKIPNPRYLHDNSEFLVAKLESQDVKFVSRIETSWKCLLNPSKILANCDGLYLIRCFYQMPGVNMFVVWNPSCRAYKAIWCPQPIGRDSVVFGIYYNPLMKDYKVVTGDREYYAEFSCRYNKWSEVKETKGISWDYGVRFHYGVSCNGSLYWLHTLLGEEFEIICFDWKDEKFKKLPTPDYKGDIGFTSSGCHLWLWYISHSPPYEIRIFKKNDKDSWMEFKVPLQSDLYSRAYHLRWVNEYEILLYHYEGTGRIYMIYDLSESTYARIHMDPSIMFNYPAVPYLENLFLQ